VPITGLTGGALEVTSSSFCDLSGCKVSHKIFGEDSRKKISKWKRRIGTSEGMSVLPIRFLC
jgi:hypothetical protein